VKTGIKETVGKTVRAVIIAENSPAYLQNQVFLVFTDRTFYEMYGSEIHQTGGMPEGDLMELWKNYGRLLELSFNLGQEGRALAVKYLRRFWDRYKYCAAGDRIVTSFVLCGLYGYRSIGAPLPAALCSHLQALERDVRAYERERN